MSDVAEFEPEPLVGTSAVRGVLLLGGVATVAFFAWKYWNNIRALDSGGSKPAVVRIPISLPLVQEKKKTK
jgi:hypothetical protein